MSRNLSTYVKQILGPGHVVEDGNPTPIAFRNTAKRTPAASPVPDPPKVPDNPTPHPIP